MQQPLTSAKQKGSFQAEISNKSQKRFFRSVITYADEKYPLIFVSNFYIDRLVFPWVDAVPKSFPRVL
jgi:hypothetical protein